MKLIFTEMPKRSPALIRPVARVLMGAAKGAVTDPQLVQHLDYLESELGRTTWFAGEDFSAADIQMSFPLEAAVARAGLDASRPKLWAFLANIHERPAYKKALERGGPYDLPH
jgi:glutathione S-transferase